ncbi:unnamed protein product [Ilex paraguariensis]|uniref:Uncharacterized protein n=1 Tax=Ilex paraguariensis TaxID=185542 RepID=A0ABC8SNG6_9AQUA
MLGPLFEDLRGPPKYMLLQISRGNLQRRGDKIIDSDDETEGAEAPFNQKLFGILRIYYTLLDSLKRVSLGIVAGASSGNWSGKSSAIILLCMTSFQLFFMVLKKPFIKKKVQLVEIISVCSEVGIFSTCLVLLEKEFSAREEMKIGIFMLSLFFLAFMAQMINEWHALYRQTKQLDTAGDSFLLGLKTASIGLLFFMPQGLIKNLDSKFSLNNRGAGKTGDPASFDERNTSSSSGGRTSGDKPWLRQLRELAKASFSKERSGDPNVPSTSHSKWSSRFWGAKRSGSSSTNSSLDFKSKPRGLYKDLEAIFASK